MYCFTYGLFFRVFQSVGIPGGFSVHFSAAASLYIFKTTLWQTVFCRLLFLTFLPILMEIIFFMVGSLLSIPYGYISSLAWLWGWPQVVIYWIQFWFSSEYYGYGGLYSVLWFSRMQMLLIALNFSLLDCLNLSQGSGISLLHCQILSCGGQSF